MKKTKKNNTIPTLLKAAGGALAVYMIGLYRKSPCYNCPVKKSKLVGAVNIMDLCANCKVHGGSFYPPKNDTDF